MVTANQEEKFKNVMNEAEVAAFNAGTSCKPEPMVVVDGTGRSYYVSEGVCGFASVIITPATSSFVKWLKKNDIGSKHWKRGWQIWVSQFGQSYDRKRAYARAMAEVFNKHGFKSHVESNLD